MNSIKLLLIATVLLVFSSCQRGDEDPDPVEETPVIFLPETKTLEVLPEGSELEMESGIKMSFPPGAVNTSTEISISNINPFGINELETDTIDGLKFSSLIRCKPDGQIFSEPVEVTIPIVTQFFGEDLDPQKLYVLGVSRNTTDTLEVEVDMISGVAKVEITHFTDFFIKYDDGSWIVYNRSVDQSADGNLTIQFSSMRRYAEGTKIWKEIQQMKAKKILQMKSVSVGLYRKRIGTDRFLGGIQTFCFQAWTSEDYKYSYSIKEGVLSGNKDAVKYNELPRRKKRIDIFNITEVNRTHEKTLGVYTVRFGPDKEVVSMDFLELRDDFDIDVLDHFTDDGNNYSVELLPIHELESDDKYYFKIQIIANGDIINDSWSNKGDLTTTTFKLKDLGDAIGDNNPPEIKIISPMNGETFTENEEISFQCSVSDTEDEIEDNQVKWNSSVSGEIGSGKSMVSSDLGIGVHKITASVTDEEGLKASETVQIEVQKGESVVADFSTEKVMINIGEVVSFIDRSSGNPENWVWNFGDGSSSNLQHPSHSYTEAGTYTVSLTASNAYGSDTEIKTDYITVNASTEDKPDLLVQSVDIEPSSPEVNETFEISVSVKNIGLEASGICKLAVLVDGESSPTVYDVDGLLPGESFVEKRTLSMSNEGNYSVAAMVDSFNEVDESNESNNEQVFSFSVTEGGSSGTGINFNPDLTYGSVSDIDGNTYKTIQIGDQVWMAENLRTTRYADGTSIPNVVSSWHMLDVDDKAYCWYENSTTNRDVYGGLYNWSAAVNGISGSDSNPSGIQGACPSGWHLPSDAEWKELEIYLGMSPSEANDWDWRGKDVGEKLKESGTAHWDSPSLGVSNVSGFTALPGGYYSDDESLRLGFRGYFWSTSEGNSLHAYYRSLSFAYGEVYRSLNFRNSGFSIRCVRDY